MKIRTDFVSNSSSTAFIVISDKKLEKYNFNYQDLVIPNENGNMQFGWDYAKHKTFWDKLNFCAIQLIDLKNEEDNQSKYHGVSSYCGKFKRFFAMLKKVCSEEFHLDITLRKSEDCYFYIDHQSSVTEDANMEMFENETSLYNFLASADSYIVTDNDNESHDGEYDEEYD